MGSCVSSSHNNKTSSTDKLPSLISEPETIATTTSPVKNDVITPATINENSMIDSGRRDSSGNKEEMMFFESRGWLDSDCEDDFMSVDGEFTPSRGTTPVHHKFCDQTLKAEEKKHEVEPSPTDNKKRLLELFKETQDEDKDEEEDDVVEGKPSACFWLRTPVRSSAPATPYNYNDRGRQQLKRVRSAAHGGCVPRLVSCSSFTERRRKMMSHAHIYVQR